MSDFNILCPNCGRRPAIEFSFGGEFSTYPAGGVESHDENYERVWLWVNSRGAQTERWFHSGGCRRWVTVVRDTATNRFP